MFKKSTGSASNSYIITQKKWRKLSQSVRNLADQHLSTSQNSNKSSTLEWWVSHTTNFLSLHKKFMSPIVMYWSRRMN
jgi:hypothetical protein